MWLAERHTGTSRLVHSSALGRDRAVGYGVGRSRCRSARRPVLDHGLALLADDDALAVVRVHQAAMPTPSSTVVRFSQSACVGIFAHHAAARAHRAAASSGRSSVYSSLAVPSAASRWHLLGHACVVAEEVEQAKRIAQVGVEDRARGSSVAVVHADHVGENPPLLLMSVLRLGMGLKCMWRRGYGCR